MNLHIFTLVFAVIFVLPFYSRTQEMSKLRLSTSDSGFMSVIEGFAAELQCTLNSCIKDATRVRWLKNNQEIYSGLEATANSEVDFDPQRVELQHSIIFDNAKSCSGAECSDSEPCEDGFQCRQNNCCACESEEFSLVHRNLTFTDAGLYRCELDSGDQLLEFQLDVLESGLEPGFHENITYDHSACCANKGISLKCQPICKPRQMAIHPFDPTNCRSEDFKAFLGCVTDGGKRSHVHCCKVHDIPPFCWDLCSGHFASLRRAHRLCLYYLPDILDCYERAFLPYPDPPEKVEVNSMSSDELKVCWESAKPSASSQNYSFLHYTVNYKQIPSFPFLGGEGGIPLLTGDRDYESTEAEEESILNDFESFLRPTLHHDSLTDIPSEEHHFHSIKKRQTFVFIAHNTLTNESQYREYKFKQLNTTDTCMTLRDLRAGTRYMVYVTTTNEFGSSLPSVKAMAVTQIMTLSVNNNSMPDIQKCCQRQNVSDYCARKMCSLDEPPSLFGAMAISTACKTEFIRVSPCLADGRNHSECCIRKGVQSECLKICQGRAEPLGLHSLLCLSLDLTAVYQCLRQGYETHPTAPENLTVTEVTWNSARLVWSAPHTNADKVVSYSVFVRRDRYGEPFVEIERARSPHVLLGLEPDSAYLVYVESVTAAGRSLPSTILQFYTRTRTSVQVCPFGQPLFHPNGHRYYCGMGIRQCPPQYDCIVVGSETNSVCCPTSQPVASEPKSINEKFKKCCETRGVTAECQKLCSYNMTVRDLLTLGKTCLHTANDMAECAADGRDHESCCVQSEVPDVCLSACRPPLVQLTDEHSQCIKHISSILKCSVQGIGKLPGPVQHFELIQVNSSSVRFAWDPPSQTPPVKHYQIFIFENDQLKQQKNTSGLTVTFNNLDPDREYKSRVVSWNDHGSSIPTMNISFDTPKQGCLFLFKICSSWLQNYRPLLYIVKLIQFNTSGIKNF